MWLKNISVRSRDSDRPRSVQINLGDVTVGVIQLPDTVMAARWQHRSVVGVASIVANELITKCLGPAGCSRVADRVTERQIARLSNFDEKRFASVSLIGVTRTDRRTDDAYCRRHGQAVLGRRIRVCRRSTNPAYVAFAWTQRLTDNADMWDQRRNITTRETLLGRDIGSDHPRRARDDRLSVNRLRRVNWAISSDMAGVASS